MSGIIPPFVGRWLRHAYDHLPLSVRDALTILQVQTQLIFTRAIFVILLAAFGYFTWLAFTALDNEQAAYDALALQTLVMALLTSMNLWSAESEGRTFELLMMRMRSPGHLIWFKLRVALIWMVILSFPLFIAVGWFVEIPRTRLFLFWGFSMMGAVLPMLLTCVVTTFVRNGLTASGLAVVMAFPVAAVTENAHLGWLRFFRIFISPMRLEQLIDRMTPLQQIITVVGNRLVWLAAVACLLWWLYNRLSRVERWIR